MEFVLVYVGICSLSHAAVYSGLKHAKAFEKSVEMMRCVQIQTEETGKAEVDCATFDIGVQQLPSTHLFFRTILSSGAVKGKKLEVDATFTVVLLKQSHLRRLSLLFCI